MIEKEITQTEFDNKKLHSAKEMLKILKHKYSKEYQETINGLIQYCQDMDMLEGCEPKKYSVSEINLIFDESQIIEYLDGCVNEEILINYFVTDQVGTDKGIWNMIIENGYALL